MASKPELWVVVWDDAHGGNDDVSAKDADDFEAWRLTSVGWLVRNTERGITIAMEYGPEETEFRTYTFIPHAYVVSAMRLTYKETEVADEYRTTKGAKLRQRVRQPHG